MKRRPPEERFWGRVDRNGPETSRADGRCWVWTGPLAGGGYANFSVTKNRQVRAHRFAYEALVGPVPEGLVLDHLCRVRHCVNPAHLEPVTRKTNSLRGIGPTAVNATKTHCPKGHPYDDENTYIQPSRHGRLCRACTRERFKRLADARRAVISAPGLDLLWRMAQHKYGWAYCPNTGRGRLLTVATALERQGLVIVNREQIPPTCSATAAGRGVIAQRWPVSPFVLGTYDPRPGGWTPRLPHERKSA